MNSVLVKLDLKEFSKCEELLHDQIKAQLVANGIVLFKNLVSEDHFIRIGESLGTLDTHNDKGVIERIQNLESMTWKGKGYSQEALQPHTDRSPTANPPKYLLTALKTAAVYGGESTFVDGAQMKKVLQEKYPELFEMLSGNESFLFKKYDGTFEFLPIFDHLKDGTDFIRFRLHDVAFVPKLAENYIKLLEILNNLMVTVALKAGEGYILDNHRWLHGRKAFSGIRELLHMLVI